MPDTVGKTLLSAVEMVATVVRCERVGMIVQLKTATSDAVGKAADGGAQIAVVVDIFFQCVITQHNIHGVAVMVRHHHRPDRGTKGDDFTGNGPVV